MSGLTDITDKPCRRGHWYSEDNINSDTGIRTRSIYHYRTCMLEYCPSTNDVLYMSTGWGSVSDQNGMNKLFRKLGIHMYYCRAGGAYIIV